MGRKIEVGAEQNLEIADNKVAMEFKDAKKKRKKEKKNLSTDESVNGHHENQSAKKKNNKRKKDEVVDEEEQQTLEIAEEGKEKKKKNRGENGGGGGGEERGEDDGGVVVSGKNINDEKYKALVTFDDSGLPAEVLDCCKKFCKPSAIQSRAWPFLLDGRDFIGIAATGSGNFD